MDAQKINEYWMSTDTYLTQEHRDWNAQQVNMYLSILGWTPQAIAAILGNMDVESSLNPALIEGRGYPQLLTNQQCLALPDTVGVGLVQWTGYTDTDPAGQKLASFAIRYGRDWYDGDVQCFRLEREWNENLQFDPGTVDGVYYDWDIFVSSTLSPSVLAKAWQVLYERGGSDTATRQQKAEYYYHLLRPHLPVWLMMHMQQRKESAALCRRL